MISCHLYCHVSFSCRCKRHVFEFCCTTHVCVALLSPSLIQMRILDKFPIDGGQKDPKKRIIPFLPGDKHNSSQHAQHPDISHINFRFIQETAVFKSPVSTSERKAFRHFHAQLIFVSTPTYSIAWPTTLHYFINCHTSPRPNQFVVCHGSRRLPEKDLSNLINSLWASREEQ